MEGQLSSPGGRVFSTHKEGEGPAGGSLMDQAARKRGQQEPYSAGNGLYTGYCAYLKLLPDSFRDFNR
jgi:hypothetical protein